MKSVLPIHFTHALRRRPLFFRLAASSLLIFTLSTAARAQCVDKPVLHHLDAGTTTPMLRTPKGAAVIGGGFSLRVFDAAPSSTGILFYSAFENPLFDPLLGATIWPATPWLTKSFGTSAQGISGAQFNTTVVTEDLCGAFATFQAVIVDANAPSGFTITNAVRLRVGAVTDLVFGPLEETASYNDVVFADVDGDALRDKVVAEANSFSVSLGLSTGGFSAPVTYGHVGGSTRAPLLGDLNADGNTDLIDASGDVGVILLDANGGVLGAASFDAGASVIDGTLGDFDLDGSLDLVVLRQGGSLGWMKGTGDGALLFPQDINLGAPVSQVEAGYMDGDGLLDLVVSTSATVVALGNGDGTFTTLAPTGPVALAGLSVLDLDLDGELDVVGFSGKALGVQLGNGDGSLSSLQIHIAADVYLKDYVLIDLDGDGRREAIALSGHLAVANVFVSQGLPGGLFGPWVAFGGLRDPKAVAAADLDLDGAADVLIAGPSSTLTLPGLGDGSLDAARVVSVGEGAFALRGADVNGDAFADAFVLNGVSDDVSVLLGGPDGLTFHASFPTGPSPHAFDVADFTGDQLLDIVVCDAGSNDIRVLPGDGFGNFGSALVSATPFGALQLQHADFDEDGVRDVALGRTTQSNGVVLLGNGDGTFGAATVLPKTGRVHAVGRLDGDAHVDLYLDNTVTHPSGQSTVLFGNGDGTFTVGAGFSSGFGYPPRLADLDSDGDQDLVNWWDGFLQVGINNGSGSFSFLSFPSMSGVGHGIAVGDLDEDGHPDLVLGSRHGFLQQDWFGTVRFLHGHGDGTFTLAVTIPSGNAVYSPYELVAGDFDADGILDVAWIDVCCPTGIGRLWTLLNRVGE